MSIGSFLLRRLGSGALAIVGVSILVFAFLHLVPGDPVDHLAGGEATPAQRLKIEQCMGLDQSMPRQFVRFLGNVVDGSLGHQCPDPKGKPTVAARIAEVFPHTLWLAIAGMLVAIVLALPLGMVAAIRRGTWIDTLATTTSLSMVGLPQMLFAPLLLFWFFVVLGWFPGPTELGPSALVLPAFAVGSHLMAMLARMTRSSMVEVLGEDYVRTARAKGLPEGRVLFHHALRNALLPVITILGLSVPSLIGGSVIFEQIFAIPGMGRLFYDAVMSRDYPLVMGILVIGAVLTLLGNLLADVSYAVADPRLRRR